MQPLLLLKEHCKQLTATMAASNQDLKRVISNPEAIIAESDREDKKTRVEHMIKTAVLGNNATLENRSDPDTSTEEENVMIGGERAPDRSVFKISATMSQDGSRLSSLSGEEGSNSDEDSMDEDGGVALKKGSSGRIKRSVSHDGSISNSNSSSHRQASSTGGDWGWFEGHGHENSAASGGESLGGGGKGDGKKNSKKSGIWTMGSDLMEAIIEPKQGETMIQHTYSTPTISFVMVVLLFALLAGAIYLAQS